MPRRRNKNRPKVSGEKLWEAVKKTTKPLKDDWDRALLSEGPAQIETPKAKPRSALKETDPSRQEPALSMPVELTRRERRNVQQGRTRIDRTLDLHGMTQAQAHNFLAQALMGAQAEDCRRLLVITGKGGGPGTEKTGILRTQVPLWLKEGPLSHYVSRLAKAGTGHGGDGALYVFLKRRKGPGK